MNGMDTILCIQDLGLTHVGSGQWLNVFWKQTQIQKFIKLIENVAVVEISPLKLTYSFENIPCGCSKSILFTLDLEEGGTGKRTENIYNYPSSRMKPLL